MTLSFESNTAKGKVWLAALQWMKAVFARQQRLAKQPLEEEPLRTIPTRLRSFLLDFDPEGEPVGLRGDRYEFWIYQQLRKRLNVGDIYLDDSKQHRVLRTTWCPWRTRLTHSKRWTSLGYASRWM